jgi:DNA-directed RNA polymerase
MYSKIKLNLKVTIRDKDDNKKQIRALMPNLIHSLDGTSLNLLYELFIKTFKTSSETQFFSVHDCFGTTCDKAFTLKVLLASVYTDIYSNDPYLYKFDNYVLDHIENNIKDVLDRKNRTVILPNSKTKYVIHDLD